MFHINFNIVVDPYYLLSKHLIVEDTNLRTIYDRMPQAFVPLLEKGNHNF
jgi:hypothetical protein